MVDFKRRPTYNGANLALITDIVGGNSPAWQGVYHSNMSNCDPIALFRDWQMNSVAGPTPTNIGSTVARIVKFENPSVLTVNKIYLFGVAVVASLYKFAIYRDSDKAKIWESGLVTSALNTWLAITTGLPITLASDTDYWFAVTTPGTGTVAGFRSPHAPLAPAFWGAASAPFGNVSLGFPVFAQFTVTAGAFPVTMPAIAAAAYAGATTGSVPFAILSSL
jgi:hypothetical protein